MNINTPFIRIFSLALVVGLLLSGCGVIQLDEGGAMQTETHALDAGTAASVKVQIEMDQGVLDIRSSSTKLMEGTFQYNITEWKPQVDYLVAGSQGNLLVSQPDQELVGLVKNGENHWDLQLGKTLPMELEVSVGAGESEIDLTEIDLTNLHIDTGIGNLELDLRGHWSHDLNITISGGIGEVTLHLPDEIGARVEVSNGFGNVNRQGMKRDGNAFVNKSFGKSPYTLHIRIDNGTGSVNLES